MGLFVEITDIIENIIAGIVTHWVLSLGSFISLIVLIWKKVSDILRKRSFLEKRVEYLESVLGSSFDNPWAYRGITQEDKKSLNTRIKYLEHKTSRIYSNHDKNPRGNL